MLKEIIKIYKFIFHNEILVTKDAHIHTSRRKDWVNINDIKLRGWSDVDNTYYGWDVNIEKSPYAKFLHSSYFWVYQRIILSSKEYFIIKAFKIYGRKKLNKEIDTFILTFLFSLLLLSIIIYMLII